MKTIVAGYLVVISLGVCSICFAAPATLSIPAGYPDAVSLQPGAGKAFFKDYPTRKKVKTISAPGLLTENDTEYRLEQDIAASGTAFVIKASRVTLNLNGHRVTYLDAGEHKDAYGVHIPGYNWTDIAVVNGSIHQGQGACSGSAGGIGCNPVYSYDAKNVLIAGLDVSYRTAETSGIVLHWNSDAEVCHNTVDDKGNVVNNRHQGVAAIEANRGGRNSRQKIHHNLVRGARHNGIRSGTDSDVYQNEVHGESVVTNSVALSASGGAVHDNKVFGRGVHPIGIWPGSNIKVYGNYVEIQSTARGGEYGDTGAACLRMTWGNDNVDVFGNTFILNAEENYQNSGFKSWGRAIWVGLTTPEQKALFHDNFIYARSRDGKAKAAAIAVVCNNVSPGLEFRKNIISSNWGNVLLADNYGHGGGYPRFVDNIFVGDTTASSYRTVISQRHEVPSTGVFIGNSYTDGASRDSVELEFNGSGSKEVSFGWHLTVALVDQKTGSTIADAEVRVLDAQGKVVFEGKTDGNGLVVTDLLEYTLSNTVPGKPGKQKIVLIPHTVTVESGIRKTSKSIWMGSNNLMRLEL